MCTEVRDADGEKRQREREKEMSESRGIFMFQESMQVSGVVYNGGETFNSMLLKGQGRGVQFVQNLQQPKQRRIRKQKLSQQKVFSREISIWINIWKMFIGNLALIQALNELRWAKQRPILVELIFYWRRR